MKKKLTAVALVVCMLAIMLVGASLAYFTDTDEATNTFTAGGVKIDLIEQERDGQGVLQQFTQNQVLMPIVGSAQGEKDALGQPVAKNYVDKIVTIENTGKSAAYIRAYFAIPSALDDGYETFNAGANTLHFNFGNKDGVSTYGVQWEWKQDNGKWNYFETTIDGVAYNVYFADYYQPLAANATTEQFISGLYLDKSFDQRDGVYYAFNEEIDLSGLMVQDELTIKCPVKAVAVQAEGFDSVAAAVDAAFGAKFNPFGGTATNWQ